MESIKNSNNENLDRGRHHKQGLISLKMIFTRMGEFLIRSQDAEKNPSKDIFSMLNCQNIPNIMVQFIQKPSHGCFVFFIHSSSNHGHLHLFKVLFYTSIPLSHSLKFELQLSMVACWYLFHQVKA